MKEIMGKKEKLEKKLFKIQVLFGEPDFISFLKNQQEEDSIPSRVFFKRAYSEKQARFLVERHLERFNPDLDYQFGDLQIGIPGSQFNPVQGRFLI
jgi:hypothetical protein